MSRPVQCLAFFAAALLMAADSSWKNTEIAQWTLQDARQVLAASPWVRKAEVAAMPQRSESQMREGGRMGMTSGAGLGALNPSVLTGLGSGKRLISRPAKRQTLVIRWESATPVRDAELKTKDTRAPAWDGDYYAIAIYDVRGLEDQKTLPLALKKSAFLRREGKKDLRPQQVSLLFDDDGELATVLYLFPKSGEITAADKHVWFAAQIGTLFVEQSFDPGEMQYQNKLEL